MKQIVVVPQFVLRDRDPLRVDAIVGKKRKSVRDCEPVDFSNCPLAQAYPNLDNFLEEIYKQRMEQKTGGRLAHPRAIAPLQPISAGVNKNLPAWADGPSVADVNKVYGTTDRGR